MPTIVTENLRKRFGSVQALDGVSLTVDEGTVFGMIGPDGAGKSTLIRVLATLTTADEGMATVCGHTLPSDYRAVRREIGYMPELFSLYPDLTVWENLSFFAALFNVSIADNYSVIAPVFKQLEPFRDRKAGKLSGGMKQKLALSCALIHRPKLLLLDEPTRGVDPVSRKEFWKILSLIRDEGISIFLSTSYMDEAMLCDTVGLVSNGKFLTVGSPSEIIAGYKPTLCEARSSDLYSLLAAARQWEGTLSSYTFGDSIHVALPDASGVDRLRAHLSGGANGDVTVCRIEPTIEDCFMNQIENEQNN